MELKPMLRGDNPAVSSAPEARRRTTINDNHQVGPTRALIGVLLLEVFPSC